MLIVQALAGGGFTLQGLHSEDIAIYGVASPCALCSRAAETIRRNSRPPAGAFPSSVSSTSENSLPRQRSRGGSCPVRRITGPGRLGGGSHASNPLERLPGRCGSKHCSDGAFVQGPVIDTVLGWFDSVANSNCKIEK